MISKKVIGILSIIFLGFISVAHAQTQISQTLASFPVTITTSGSYILTSNLTPPANTSGIVINSDNVSIDLNGFSIIETPTTSGVWGITTTSNNNITVKNGKLIGVGVGLGASSSNLVSHIIVVNSSQTDGIDVGLNGIVEYSSVSTANGVGLECGTATPANNCMFTFDVSYNNSVHGVGCGSNCNINHNLITSNAGTGIDCAGTGCAIEHNTINTNTLAGIATSDNTSGAIENIVNGNSGGSINNAKSGGNNICNGSIC